MLFNHAEVIPLVLLLPVVLNILLPLGMLAAYLLLGLIRWGLSLVLGTAAAQPKMAVVEGSDSPAGRCDAATTPSEPSPALQD